MIENVFKMDGFDIPEGKIESIIIADLTRKQRIKLYGCNQLSVTFEMKNGDTYYRRCDRTQEEVEFGHGYK